jgi:hypothetical protein
VISNEELWRTEEIEMSTLIKRWKWNWVGHTLRKGNEAIESERPWIGTRKGKGGQGDLDVCGSEALKKGESWSEVKKMAGNRTRWRCFVDALCALRYNGN